MGKNIFLVCERALTYHVFSFVLAMYHTKNACDNVRKLSNIIAGLLLLFIFLLIYVSFYGNTARDGVLSKQKLMRKSDELLLKLINTQQKLLIRLENSMTSINNGIERQIGTESDGSSRIQKQISDLMKTMKKTMLTLSQKVESLQSTEKKKNDQMSMPTAKESVRKMKIKHVLATEQGENYRHIRKKELENLELDFEEVQPLMKPALKDMHDKWIVVTSIFKPTDDLRILAAIPGWKMVVVGDTKTPKDWK